MDATAAMVIVAALLAGALVAVTLLLRGRRDSAHEVTQQLTALNERLGQVVPVVDKVTAVETGLHTLAQHVADVESRQERTQNDLTGIAASLTQRLEQMAPVVDKVTAIVERLETVEKRQDQAQQDVTQVSKTLVQGLATLAPVVEKVSNLELGLEGLSKRLGTVEQTQTETRASLQNLRNQLTEASTTAESLTKAATVIREELGRTQEKLAALESQAQERQRTEQAIAESIRRLETVIAGVHSRGEAGENILEAIFGKLPPEIQERNFRLGNKVVEFALRLPNNRVLPIDSKWSAVEQLERLARCQDPEEARKLRDEIEKALLSRAREVRQYVDPTYTVGFAVAVVPDAVYDACPGARVEAFRDKVVVLSYSLFVPYLLLVMQTFRGEGDLDMEELQRHLETIAEGLRKLQDELESRFSRALKMLENSQRDMVAHLGRMNTSVASIRATALRGGDGAEALSAPGNGAALPAGDGGA